MIIEEKKKKKRLPAQRSIPSFLFSDFYTPTLPLILSISKMNGDFNIEELGHPNQGNSPNLGKEENNEAE